MLQCPYNTLICHGTCSLDTMEERLVWFKLALICLISFKDLFSEPLSENGGNNITLKYQLTTRKPSAQSLELKMNSFFDIKRYFATERCSYTSRRKFWKKDNFRLVSSITDGHPRFTNQQSFNVSKLDVRQWKLCMPRISVPLLAFPVKVIQNG